MAILTLRRVHILAFIEEDGWMEEGMMYATILHMSNLTLTDLLKIQMSSCI